MSSRFSSCLLLLVGSVALRAQQPAAAPEATFDGATGKIALSDYRGKQAVVLLFMRGYAAGLTCYYCGEQTREYRDQYAAFKAAGAEVVMVLPLAKDGDIAGYVRKIGEGCKPPDPALTLPFPVVRDGDGSACKAYHIATGKSETDPFPVSTPVTVVIGKDGGILFEQHGSDPSDRPDAAAVLDVVRTGKAKAATKAAAATTPPPSRAWSKYDDGMRAAKAGRRPILLEFHAVW